jgi:hypothetical protein
MKTVIIENPVINSPYEEPRRHFRFTEDGITDEVVEGRCIREYFVPIPRAWTLDKIGTSGNRSFVASFWNGQKPKPTVNP